MPRKLSYEEQLQLKILRAAANLNGLTKRNCGPLHPRQLEAALRKAGLAIVTKDALTYYRQCADTVSNL